MAPTQSLLHFVDRLSVPGSKRAVLDFSFGEWGEEHNPRPDPN